MKAFKYFWAGLLVLQLGGAPALLAQPVLLQPNDPFRNNFNVPGSGITNLRVVNRSEDGTRAQLIMNYSYDGFGGPVARILPVIGKRGEESVSAWFGSDPVTVGRGRGTITVQVSYFNDEAGVPPMFTSDQVRILILNSTGTAVLTAVPFLKTIQWGSADAPAPTLPAPVITRTTAAEAEAAARKLAGERALAEAKAREAEQIRAEAEARRLAQEQRLAEERARAEAVAREQARQRAEAEEGARRELEGKALAEANAREEARLAAETEAKRIAEAARLAEAKRIEQEKALQAAAEAEASRLAEEKRQTEKKALAEAAARKAAEEKAYQEALAQAKAEFEARRLAKETAAAPRQTASPPVQEGSSIELAPGLKSRITNVDVVNRSLDRSEMTIGVEFEYRDRLKKPLMGVDITRQAETGVSSYFASPPSELGRSRRNFMLFPVKFHPPAGLPDSAAFSTDKVLVYLMEKASGQKLNLFSGTMMLMWRAPGGQAGIPRDNGNSVQIDDFKQNDASTGYVSIKYHLLDAAGKLRVKVFDSRDPRSAEYFSSKVVAVEAGRGLQLIDVKVEQGSPGPSNLLRADTIQVDLLDENDEVVASVKKETPMVWAKPKF